MAPASRAAGPLSSRSSSSTNARCSWSAVGTCYLLWHLCTGPFIFDRYLLPVLPLVFILALRQAQREYPPTRWKPLVGVGLIGLLSLIGTREYLAWNGARDTWCVGWKRAHPQRPDRRWLRGQRRPSLHYFFNRTGQTTGEEVSWWAAGSPYRISFHPAQSPACETLESEPFFSLPRPRRCTSCAVIRRCRACSVRNPALAARPSPVRRDFLPNRHALGVASSTAVDEDRPMAIQNLRDKLLKSRSRRQKQKQQVDTQDRREKKQKSVEQHAQEEAERQRQFAVQQARRRKPIACAIAAHRRPAAARDLESRAQHLRSLGGAPDQTGGATLPLCAALGPYRLSLGQRRALRSAAVGALAVVERLPPTRLRRRCASWIATRCVRVRVAETCWPICCARGPRRPPGEPPRPMFCSRPRRHVDASACASGLAAVSRWVTSLTWRAGGVYILSCG